MGEEKRVWVVSDVLSEDGRVWELIGIFDTEAAAVAACRAPNHSVWSVVLNTTMYEPAQIAPDVRYPLAELSP